MSCATEVLCLRRDQSSSVEALLAAMDWQRGTEGTRNLMRGHAVIQAADIVLLKVAAHAADAQALFNGGGFSLTPPQRPVRPGSRIVGRHRRPHVTRQLRFAAFA